MTKKIIPGLLAAVSVFAGASPAFAVERVLSIGQYAFDSTSGDEVVTVNTGDTFLIDLSASRSYSCEGFASDTATDFDWSTTVTGITSSTNVTAFPAGSIVPIVAGEVGGTADNRITMTPTATDRYRLTVANAKAGGEKVRIRCVSTTLFGSFNTVLNDSNYVEITNKGNAALSVDIVAIPLGGGTQITIAQGVQIAAQSRFDFDLAPVGSNKYGFVRVTHNGPLGTLDAVVSQYQAGVLRATIPTTILDPRP